MPSPGFSPASFILLLISNHCYWNLVAGDSSLENLVWIWGKDRKFQASLGEVGVGSFSTIPNEWMSLLELLTSAGWHRFPCYQSHSPGHGRWFMKAALQKFPTKPTNSYTLGSRTCTLWVLWVSCISWSLWVACVSSSWRVFLLPPRVCRQQL